MDPDRSASDSSDHDGRGLFASSKGVFATIVDILYTRFELLTTEIEEEKLRLTAIAVFAFFALFFSAMTIVLATVFVVVAFWDSHKLWVLGGGTGVFFALTVLATLNVASRVRTQSRLFRSSLAELAKDRQKLRFRPWTSD